MWPFSNKRQSGSQPDGQQTIVYRAAPRPMQDLYNNVWASGVTQYGTRVTNNWWGNQLPGHTNTIPGVQTSQALFAHQRNFQLASNVRLDSGTNIQTAGQASSNKMMQASGTQWDGLVGGLWQRREN